MDIYWVENKKKMGPKPEVEIITMLENGDVTPDTLGWHKGCAGWIPLSELPALSSFFLPRIQEERKEVESENSSRGMSLSGSGDSLAIPLVALVSQPPWPVRILAKIFDLQLFACLWLVVISLFQWNLLHLIQSPNTILVYGFSYLFYETLWLGLVGGTPGKLLLGMRVYSVLPKTSLSTCAPGTSLSPDTTPQCSQLTWSQSLWRAFMMLLFGFGFFIDFLMLISLIYTWLVVSQQGVTKWDNSAKTRVSGGRPSMLNLFFVMVLLFFIFFLIGHLIMPWSREIISQSPFSEEIKQILLSDKK